jgi:hypothetical protein
MLVTRRSNLPAATCRGMYSTRCPADHPTKAELIRPLPSDIAEAETIPRKSDTDTPITKLIVK